MSSTWELKEKSTGELTTAVEGDVWKAAQKKSFKKLAKNVNLPGFRKGHAPEALLKKQISTQHILMEAIDEVANEALSKGVKEHDLQLVARPELGIDSIDEDKVVFKFTVTVKPEVKLGTYKGVDVKKEDAGVTDADVEEELARLQDRFAELVVKEDGKVENGDTAIIDFEGFKDGVPFEGGKGEAYPLVIGSGSFIPGFEEQLLGMKSEETKDVNVTFPENYQAAELAGQPATFKVTVHDIKAKVLPEVNDELIAQAEIENVKTVDEYKEHARKSLAESKEKSAAQKFENEVLTAVVDGAEVEIPDVMIEEETDHSVREFAQRLQTQGFSMEQFQQITGQTNEMIREELKKEAEGKVKVRLVLEAIAAEENIEISDAEVEAELNEVANNYHMPVEQVKQLIAHDAVVYDLRLRKALELIKESAGK